MGRRHHRQCVAGNFHRVRHRWPRVQFSHPAINDIAVLLVKLQHGLTASLQWAAYFGRAVAKIDHTCATLPPAAPCPIHARLAVPAKNLWPPLMRRSNPLLFSTSHRQLHKLASYRCRCFSALEPARCDVVDRRFLPPRSCLQPTFLASCPESPPSLDVLPNLLFLQSQTMRWHLPPTAATPQRPKYWRRRRGARWKCLGWLALALQQQP